MGALIVAMILQGCIGLLDDDLETDEAETSLPPIPTPEEVTAYAETRLIQAHEHDALHDEHVGAIGIAPLAFQPARETSYPDGEIYPELAVKDGYAYLAFGPRDGFINAGDEAGVILYDVSEPSAPEELARWLGQPPGDVEVSNDGELLFVSTQRNGYPYPYAINPEAGPTGQLPRGTFLVDISDKSAPETVGFAPLPPNGPHTITYFEGPDGREFLFQSTYDILFTTYPDNLGQNEATQKVVISEIARSPEPHLEPLSTFQILEPDEGDASLFPHDATAHVDPATGRIIMDVAYWEHGLVTVDITDPTDPVELARFADTGPSAYTNTHLVRVFPGTIDGKVVGVLEPEIPTGEDAGQYTFVDLTDPADPTKLGYWSLPGEHVIDQPFVFSPHNFDLACSGDGQPVSPPDALERECEDPTLVAAHFHGGLWTLDASDPTQPVPTGFFFPEVERDNVAVGFPFTGFFSAFIVDGTIYAPEAWTGLHTLAPPGR